MSSLLAFAAPLLLAAEDGGAPKEFSDGGALAEWA